VLPQAWLDGPGDEFAPFLADAGFDVVAGAPADVLITTQADANAAIASAEMFAASLPHGGEALVVHVLRAGKSNDWASTREAALLSAHVRHAALAWAPRRVRVNAIGIGGGQPPAAPATPADIAAAVLAIWELPSMTGQVIRLG